MNVLFSGFAHACAHNEAIFISNLHNGVDQYRMSNLEKVKTFNHGSVSHHPLQVSTVMKGEWLVCGGHDGVVRIFHTRSGVLLEKLPHANCTKSISVL